MPKSPSPKPRPPRRLKTSRDHVLADALRMLVALRRGRWTVYDIAEEVGVTWRTAYRMIRSLRLAGVAIELSREREGKGGIGTGYYTIPAGPLRKLLHL
jgi:predicted DNA-binding transcriptional regulator YafY